LERFGIERVANFSIYYGGEGDFLGQRVPFQLCWPIDAGSYHSADLQFTGSHP